MSCEVIDECKPLLDNAIIVNRGDALDIQINYENEDRTIIDLTGRTIEISEASLEAIILDGLVEIVEAELGLVRLLFPAELTNQFRNGRATWFRIASPSVSDEGRMVSPKIWVNVQ